MARDAFTDAAGLVNGGVPYIWPVGHESEDPDTKALGLERTALTTGEGFVRQQGAPQPTIKKLHGWIIQPAQLTKMEEFWNACAGRDAKGARTIFWQDLDGSSHEVLITDFSPQRKVGRAGGTGLGYVWFYSLTMEVIS